MNYKPTRICENQYDQDLDFSNLKDNHFTVKLTEGCFGGWVHIPAWWKYYVIDANGDAKDYWIAYWFEHQQHGTTIFRASDHTTLNPGLFRLQGHGTALFYTNSRKRTDSKELNPDLEDGPPAKIVKFELRNADPHLCQKPDDVYFASYGAAVPMPAGSGEFHNPEFQFDQKHGDKSVTWANGFTGKFTFCLVVDDKGNTTNITFPQSPGAEMEAHVKDHFSGWKHKPGWYTDSYRDKDPKYVSTQIAYEITFP